jgi:glycosyltransferase involved in cell wall biosynthesis
VGTEAVCIVPSRKPENARACVASIRASGWKGEIVIVDDGARDGAGDLPVTWMDGVRPFCYARNVNIGLRYAAGRDVIIMGDDVEVVTRGGLDKLLGLACAGNWGVLAAAVIGPVKWGPQRWRSGMRGWRVVRDVAFVCVALPARTIARVGLLDEQFEGGYGFDDTDYCVRIARAGMRCGVTYEVIVRHAANRATYERRIEDLEAHARIFERKWGRAMLHEVMNAD